MVPTSVRYPALAARQGGKADGICPVAAMDGGVGADTCRSMLSLVVIAQDAEDSIGACLDSVPFASERVVLDSGSSDHTCAVAEAHGARVIRCDWPGHRAQKNRAMAEANFEWVLSLDADERLSPAAAAELQAALENPGDHVAFSFPRLSEWCGTPLRHGRWYPDRKVRVVRRGRGVWVGDDPHDRLQADGPVRALNADILHFPYASLDEHFQTIERYSRIQARSMSARGVRAHWWDVGLRPPLHFVDAYVRRGGFRDGRAGFAVASLGASYVLWKWMRLWIEPDPSDGGP
jgi:glycosyltransferase involved in cell wall biosynthesis